MMRTGLAGRIMLTIAAFGVLVAIVGTIIGWTLVSDLNRGVGQSLQITGDVLATVDDSFGLAEDALEVLAVGVDEAEGAVRSLAGSMQQGAGALETATQLTGGEVADALEAVEQGLPAMQRAAGAIDTTLAALDALPFGPDYQPDPPLAATIADMRAQLAELPGQLREQARQVETMGEELTAATQGTVGTADALTELHARLTTVDELIDEYATTATDARALVDEQRDALAGSMVRARVIVILLGLTFALMQFVPYHYGTELLRRDEQSGREHSRPGT